MEPRCWVEGCGRPAEDPIHAGEGRLGVHHLFKPHPDFPVNYDPLSDIRHLGNPDFIKHVQGMLDTHVRKAAGYSGSDNPDTWANFREATAWGLTPLQGCLVRMGDKYRRVQNLRRNAANDRVGESIRDTLLDLANYAIIAVCLMDEEDRAEEEKAPHVHSGACGVAQHEDRMLTHFGDQPCMAPISDRTPICNPMPPLPGESA